VTQVKTLACMSQAIHSYSDSITAERVLSLSNKDKAMTKYQTIKRSCSVSRRKVELNCYADQQGYILAGEMENQQSKGTDWILL
jgi:hypothetical protein